MKPRICKHCETPAKADETRCAQCKRFLPGRSGNPRGRGAQDFRLRDLARKKTDVALATLVEVCRSSKDDRARVSAASAILDRGWGKPIQAVEVEAAKDLSGLLALAFDKD